jgi:transposase
LGRLSPKQSPRYTVFGRVGPNQSIEGGQIRVSKSFLLSILLLGYLYGIGSERKLVEELRMHLAWRWFTGLGFDQDIPQHSTFSSDMA